MCVCGCSLLCTLAPSFIGKRKPPVIASWHFSELLFEDTPWHEVGVTATAQIIGVQWQAFVAIFYDTSCFRKLPELSYVA